MAALYLPGYEAGTYLDIRRKAQRGECSGGAVTFFRQDYCAADGTMRIIYGCAASELAAYEQAEEETD